MGRIERLLAPAARRPPLVVLREPEPGDMGWVVQRHGALYARDFGFDDRFEALVARIVADFVETRDPTAERAWIAESDGEPVGSVFVVRGRRHDRQAPASCSSSPRPGVSVSAAAWSRNASASPAPAATGA